MLKKGIIKRSKYFLYWDKALLQSLVFYFVLAALLLPYYQYQINPDGISYIGIAQKYIHLNFHDAVNGYWGPLLSWLLMPFLYVGFKPLLAAKLLTLMIGAITIIQFNSLIKILQISRLLRVVLLFLVSVIIVYFALSDFTPDLLFVYFSLLYIKTIINPNYINSKYAGAISGFFGAGLFLTKSYGFPFFIVSFLLTNFIFYLYSKTSMAKKRILTNFMYGIIVFTLISGAWVSVLSYKYDQFTIGTAGNYVHSLRGPNSLGHPMLYLGLLNPPNKTAISIWEDPSYLIIKNFEVFNSIDSFNHQVEITFENIRNIATIFHLFSKFSLVILTITIVYLLEKGKLIFNNKIFLLILNLLVLISGYALLLVDVRYLWPGNILILIIGSKLLDLLLQNNNLKQISKTFLVTVFVLSFLINPVRQLYYNFDTGKDISALNNRINNLNINGRIASKNDWTKSLYLSFYNNWKYYGETTKITEQALHNELKNKMIDYYLVWGSAENEIEFIDRYEELTDGKIDQLRIYKIK
jgi:hypothetical protein